MTIKYYKSKYSQIKCNAADCHQIFHNIKHDCDFVILHNSFAVSVVCVGYLTSRLVRLAHIWLQNPHIWLCFAQGINIIYHPLLIFLNPDVSFDFCTSYSHTWL